jgi:hypothetical protein
MRKALGLRRTIVESIDKIDAIYKLREAAEQKAHAERDLRDAPTPEARDALLDAQMDLEKTTYQAIQACHECGHEHTAGTPHISDSNVLQFPNRETKPEG